MLHWENSDPSTYLILKSGTNIQQFNAKIKDFIKSKDKNTEKELFVRRFSDKYLYGQYTNGLPSGGRIAYVKLFSVIAIFILVIACINFMNLSTAKAARRIKEVGIKKVVGATVSNLVFMLSKDFLQLVVLAAFIAFPLVWWSMNEWLNGFAYRINVGVGVFLLAGVFIMVVTLVTIGFQSVKAALVNPVKSLRSE